MSPRSKSTCSRAIGGWLTTKTTSKSFENFLAATTTILKVRHVELVPALERLRRLVRCFVTIVVVPAGFEHRGRLKAFFTDCCLKTVGEQFQMQATAACVASFSLVVC